MLVGALLLATVWVFLLRYVPDPPFVAPGRLPASPSRDDLLRAFVPKAALVSAFLLVFGLLGGWVLAGRMLTPLTRITDATRIAATGSLSPRIRLPGRSDEFRELADAFDAMPSTPEQMTTNLPGQDTVWVTTSARPGTVVLTVENTGEKLAPHMLPVLVEPFQRGSGRTHTDHPGVGLRLDQFLGTELRPGPSRRTAAPSAAH